jgi:DNA-binding XRE family transcriptional regulator
MQGNLETVSAPVISRNSSLTTTRNPANYYLPMDVSSRFGVRLRQLRRERNLTQLRMAVEFGIDRTFISDVERGRKSISLPMLEVMALGLQMSLSELLRDI